MFLPCQWERTGRGSTYQFFATDDDLLEILRSGLSDALGPYSLLAEGVRRGPTQQGVRQVAPEKVLSLCSFEAQESETNVFVASHILTGANLPQWFLDDLQRACAINGLVVIQHGFVNWNGVRGPTAFGVASKIRNVMDGQIHAHEGYRRIFEALRRAAKGLAVVRTRMFDGGEGWPMTARAAAATRLGIPYSHVPAA